jgi:aspartate aminotransferase
VMSAADMKAVAAVMRKHPHVWILCDDMYEHLIFTGVEHATMAQVAPDLKDRVLTVSGVSKTYAMTGWRIGFAGGPKPLIRAMVNMQGQATAGISTVGMAAAVAALEGPQDGAREQSVAYQRRRDIAVEMLNACKGITCHKPEGAFYVFPNVAGCLGHTTAGGKKLRNDEDVCLALLEEQYVATVHGAAYHMSPYLRVSTATDDTSLVEGCKRIAAFCDGLY